MLNINPEIICNIITKAREFFAKEEVAFLDDPIESRELRDDWNFQVLAEYKNDLSFLELKATIEDLEPDQQATIVALFWIGRGDYELTDFEAAFEEAQRNWNQRTVDYLLMKPLVADHLQEALTQLGYHCDS